MSSAFCAVPTKTVNIGFGFTTIGYSVLRENFAALSVARHIGQKIRTGISLSYLMVDQPRGYNNLYAFIPSLGIQWDIVSDLTVGASLFNPAGQEYLPSGYRNIPLIWNAGLGYRLGKEVLFCLELNQQTHQPGTFRTGFELDLQSYLKFRLGISAGKITQFSFGLSITCKRYNLDLAVFHHPVLGLSPAIGLSYAFK